MNHKTKDILDRIEDSSPNESSHELFCRLRDCANEIEKLRAALASRPDVQESLASENVVKDSTPKVSQGLAQADERGAFLHAAINCPHEIDSNRVVLHYDDKQPGHNALAQLGDRLVRAAAPQVEAAQGVPDGWKLVPIKPTVEMLEAGARHIPALHVWAGMLDAAPAPVSKPEQPSQDEADLCERIIHAVEGECDGLAITEEQASNILAYLQYGAPMRDMPEAFHIVDNAIGATENYEPEGGNLRIVTLRIDAARKVRAALASALQAEAAQEQVGKAEPIAWIRFCGDGLYEGPIMNCDRRKMDEIVRVKPDEWRALVLRNDSTQENGCLTRKSMQEKALEHGFEYWRAPDEHGITGTKPQCIEFLQDLLGVEVEIEDNGCQTCNGTGMIGGPSFYAPDEGGEPCPDCCDTPSYCSSVRRCTSQDAEQPSDCGEQDCPHGVDDGACKQCYSEATRSAKGYSKEWCMRMAALEPEDGIPPAGIAASAPTLVEQGWPSDRDAAIQACALMILGICKTRPQEVWPKEIEGRIRYMLSKIAPVVAQPQVAEPKGLKEIAASFVDWELVERMRSAEEIDSEEAGMLGAMIDSQAREIEALRALIAKVGAT